MNKINRTPHQSRENDLNFLRLDAFLGTPGFPGRIRKADSLGNDLDFLRLDAFPALENLHSLYIDLRSAISAIFASFSLVSPCTRE